LLLKGTQVIRDFIRLWVIMKDSTSGALFIQQVWYGMVY